MFSFISGLMATHLLLMLLEQTTRKNLDFDDIGSLAILDFIQKQFISKTSQSIPEEKL